MNHVEHILARHFPGERYRIARPPAGLQKEAYIVQNESQKLFLKFDTDTPAWKRVAEIGVAPPLFHQGSYEGRTYIIQPFLEGGCPDREWLAQNVDLLARVVRRYHNDRPLKEMLSAACAGSYAGRVQQELATLAGSLNAASPDPFGTERLRHAFRRFSVQASQLSPVPLVPVHPDPSIANMLVTKWGLILLDWDELLLSDPMHDAGLLAWWYLPEEKWQRFIKRCGYAVDRGRICWWVARRSLEVALWFDRQQMPQPARTFLQDFYRAVDRRGNPQAAR